MPMIPVLDLPESHVPALTALLQRLPPQEYRWALTDSGGLRQAVFPLAGELTAYAAMGCTARADLIRKFSESLK
jgi:hypothetical protein